MQTPTVILVVDDEAAVLAVTASRLRHAGYSVVETTSSREGLKLLEGREDIAAIVSDCNMPEMRGTELAQVALARWPHIKFIATSGHPRAPDLPEGAEFIAKPYRAAVLISTLEKVLTSPEAAEKLTQGDVLGRRLDMEATPFLDGLSPAIAPLHFPHPEVSTDTRIVIVEWRIKTGRENDFLEYWSTRSTIPDRSGLIHEFLSRIESQEQFPWRVWDLNAAWSTYINVGFWRSAADFQQQLGWSIDDTKPLLAFEARPRQRMCLAPERWRIGHAPLLITYHPAVC